MKTVIQRVKNAEVKVEGKTVGKIEQGFLILLGVGPQDDEQIAQSLVEKICNLRVFSDENGKMNLSIKDIKGEMLLISQFTLYANCNDGNRPSFTRVCKI